MASLRLKVSEAYPGDVGRKIARIDRSSMKELGVSTGDFIQIDGSQGTVAAVVWPLRHDDEGRGIIRIDGYMRESLGVGAVSYTHLTL
ncbi:MAG: AAA family ATPase, partial [Desulfurococcales archaeon]|nr:AAA family ATPase [Desulfurococcales archaeon]